MLSGESETYKIYRTFYKIKKAVNKRLGEERRQSGLEDALGLTTLPVGESSNLKSFLQVLLQRAPGWLCFFTAIQAEVGFWWCNSLWVILVPVSKYSRMYTFVSVPIEAKLNLACSLRFFVPGVLSGVNKHLLMLFQKKSTPFYLGNFLKSVCYEWSRWFGRSVGSYGTDLGDCG